MDQILVDDEFEIVSAKAKGADTLGEEYAKNKKLPIAEFPPDWKRYRKVAGPIRNGEMAEYADMAIVFWNGNTHQSGSKNMIDQSVKKGLPTFVVRYDEKPYKILKFNQNDVEFT